MRVMVKAPGYEHFEGWLASPHTTPDGRKFYVVEWEGDWELFEARYVHPIEEDR